MPVLKNSMPRSDRKLFSFLSDCFCGNALLSTLLCVAALICNPFFAVEGRAQSLVLENAAGEILQSFPIGAPGNGEGIDGFAIRYIHSVALSPVIDYFMLKNGKIFLDKTEYMDFGAGLPHAPEKGQTMKTGDGRIIISGYARELPSFDVRVGRIANHTLLLLRGDEVIKTIPLAGLAPPGAAITLRIEPAGASASSFSK